MDRRVKERLIGASILVVLVVLIVPELLSGPAPAPVVPAPPSVADPVRSVTVDLSQGPAPAPAPAPASARAPAPVSAPLPVPAQTVAPSLQPPAPGAGLAVPAATGAPAPSKTKAAPRALETPAADPTSASPAGAAAGENSWAVQLGSFASRANADNLVHQLNSQGFVVYVSPSGSGTSLRYRVRTGPLADRETASQEMAKLKSLGYAASLVPPA